MHKIITVSTLLFLVGILIWANVYQANVIEQQRQQIHEMMQNPNCVINKGGIRGNALTI